MKHKYQCAVHIWLRLINGIYAMCFDLLTNIADFPTCVQVLRTSKVLQPVAPVFTLLYGCLGVFHHVQILILGREGNAKVNCNIQCLKSPCFALVLPCFPLPNMTTLCYIPTCWVSINSDLILALALSWLWVR